MSTKKLFPGERTSASHKVGNEEVVIWIDNQTRSIIISATTKMNTTPESSGYPSITPDGLKEREGGEPIYPFLTFTQPMLEDFPGLLPALYKALQEFFGDSMDRIPGTEKHLADMRRIVESQLGVKFDD